jgi:putative transcriptional regulator
MPLSLLRTEQNLSALRLELSIRRNLLGLTYDNLALASGVSRRTLVAIEVGTSRGSVDSWLQICDALGTTFALFLTEAFAAHEYPAMNEQRSSSAAPASVTSLM